MLQVILTLLHIPDSDWMSCAVSWILFMTHSFSMMREQRAEHDCTLFTRGGLRATATIDRQVAMAKGSIIIVRHPPQSVTQLDCDNETNAYYSQPCISSKNGAY